MLFCKGIIAVASFSLLEASRRLKYCTTLQGVSELISDTVRPLLYRSILYIYAPVGERVFFLLVFFFYSSGSGSHVLVTLMGRN